MRFRAKTLRTQTMAGRKAPLTDLQAHDLNHAFDYAVSLLARRDYSTHELKKKLAERGYTEHAYEVVVDDLEDFGKVNNERYGRNVVAYRARRGHGPARIRSQLQKSGLSRAAIDEAVKGEESPDFFRLAREARIRKFGSEIPADRKEKARQARFLQYRGFSMDHIRAALEGLADADETEAYGSD